MLRFNKNQILKLINDIFMKIDALWYIMLILTVSFSGCYQDPNYPSTPLINYESIEIGKGTIADTIRITIQIQDKEGDLGLQNNEQDPKFQTADSDGVINKFYHNFFIRTFRKNGSEYELVDFPDGQELHGRFPRFSIENGSNTMEVTLTYEFLVYFVFGSPIKRGETLRFSVQIADRALNLSNVILTDDVEL